MIVIAQTIARISIRKIIALLIACVSFFAAAIILFITSFFQKIALRQSKEKEYDQKLSKEAKQKFETICKMEHRSELDQIALIIENYIDAYSKEKKINWDEYI